MLLNSRKKKCGGLFKGSTGITPHYADAGMSIEK
jgi:hypothetical protein